MADFLKSIDTKQSPESPKFPEILDIKQLVEKAKEVVVPKEKEPQIVEGTQEMPKTTLTPAQMDHVVPLSSKVAPVTTKSEQLKVIEKVLSANLEQIYFGLDKAGQERMKKTGEETASKIELMLESGKAVAKKILHLIRQWLSKIPGVNKFFLEQESKIKTDRIMAMMRR